MAKASVTKKEKTKSLFKISRSILSKLDPSERNGAEDSLWMKSSGLCALCGQALSNNADLNVADHRIPESVSGVGGNVLSNLYLAHLSCNASRKDLPFEVARPIVGFRVFSEEKKSITFDNVIEKYVANGRQPVSVDRDGDTIVLSFGSDQFASTVSRDVATGTEYFYAEIPFEYVSNDKEIQPRLVSYPHVRRLALDFVSRPIHEPSNCRLVMHGEKAGALLQFDGQHKSTAQILLGRKTGSFKVYIEPDKAMLQELVVKIQQEIKKQPLTRSDTLAKLGDVISRLLDEYKDTKRTEQGFVAMQPKIERAAIKKLYQQELQRLVFFDGDNELAAFVKPGALGAPTTDRMVIDRMIAPLLCSELLGIDMDASGGRDTERENIIIILNQIVKNMLPPNWEKDPIQKQRTQTFFLGGAIGWWMNELLIPALRYVTMKLKDKEPLLLDALDAGVESKMVSIVDALCMWDVWSTTSVEGLAALRSNTVKNVVSVFSEYTHLRLIKEATS
ncbi:HNH endonuclease signature motif containing protein [Pseudomonas sp. MWU12-3103b]|uniref:HNH endonuclease n=1 Tax=Pseudomonas sp. MWU12-3103b TaxID=2928857 RepID=UPI001FFE9F72|nr:HNH endonuclease signature motif containing protein [Pseudomonas sp. MWU12-3103b]